MKKKIVITIYLIMILVTINIILNITINSNLIKKYNSGQYIESQAKMLSNINLQKSYIANYNYGNILYQNGEYEEAIEEYNKALKNVTSSSDECKIRINYALAICKTVQVDESSQESINNAIEDYEYAIEILTEKNCDEHNQDAKQLKQDIQNEINRLKKLQNNLENESSTTEEQESQQNQKDDIEEKIQNIKEEATQEQREIESIYKDFSKGWNDSGKNW